MEQLLVEAPLQALLGLMVILVIGIIMTGAYIFIVLKRRANKSNTENNVQPKIAIAKGVAASEFPAAGISVPPAPALSSAPLTSSSEDSLNLALLDKTTNAESVTMLNEQKPSGLESVNIGDRLNPQPAGGPQPPQSSEPVELLRLLRNPQSGQLIVEVAGQHYAKLADITDKKIGQYVLQLAAHLLAFTNGVIVTDAGMKSIYTPKVTQTPRPIAPPQKVQSGASGPAPVPKAPPEVEAAFLASLHAQSPQPEPKPQNLGFFKRSKPETPPPSVPTLNLAEEINDIVQTRLRYSPLTNITLIEITSDPGGGIRIQVNDEFYSSPDDVIDQDARELIKASIKEWEQS